MKVHDQYKILQEFHSSQYQRIDMGVSKVNPSEVVLVNVIDKSGLITPPIFDALIRNLSNVTKYYNEDKYTLVTQYNEGMPLINYAKNYPLEQGQGIALLLELLSKISDYDGLPKDIINVLLKPDQIIINDDEIALNEILNLDEMASATDFHERLKTIALLLLKDEGDDLRAFFSDVAFNDDDSLKSIYRHFRARCPKKGQAVDFDKQEHYNSSTSDSILFAPPSLNSEDDSALTDMIADDGKIIQVEQPDVVTIDVDNTNDRPDLDAQNNQMDDDMSILFKNATVAPNQDQSLNTAQQASPQAKAPFWGLPSFFNKVSQAQEEDLLSTSDNEEVFHDDQIDTSVTDTVEFADERLLDTEEDTTPPISEQVITTPPLVTEQVNTNDQPVETNVQKSAVKLPLNHDDDSMTIPIEDVVYQTDNEHKASGKNTKSASINDYIAGGATITLETIGDDQRIIEKTFTLTEKSTAAKDNPKKVINSAPIDNEVKPSFTRFISIWVGDLQKPSLRRALLVLLLGIIVVIIYACSHINRANSAQQIGQLIQFANIITHWLSLA